MTRLSNWFEGIMVLRGGHMKFVHYETLVGGIKTC